MSDKKEPVFFSPSDERPPTSGPDDNAQVEPASQNTPDAAPRMLKNSPRKAHRPSKNTDENPGKGLALPGLIVGLLSGGAIYAIGEYWVQGADGGPLAIASLLFVAIFSASYLLIAERHMMLRALFAALFIAVIFFPPIYFMAGILDNPNTARLDSFPGAFWLFLGAPLSIYLTVALTKTILEAGAPPPYRVLFFHGLTLPLIAGGAKLFAGLALVLLFAWAGLLKSMDVDVFQRLFREPSFILPFLGAIGGLSIALMRAQQSVLGALRFILLLLSRILMPITAIFSLTFLVVLAANGPDAIFDKPYPAAIMIGLAFAAMLIFNGVYQNGEGRPPPAWLRLSTIISLLSFPVYAGLAAYALWLRIDVYGLTPPRVIGMTITCLAAAYSLVGLAGLITEVNWRGARWMPLVGPLNISMAALWVVVLYLLATPVIDPWAMSARNQFQRLASEKVDAEKFDFGYLRFKLGEPGDQALDRILALDNHPQSDFIAAEIARARAADSKWAFDYPEAATDVSVKAPPVVDDGGAPQDAHQNTPMDLPINPGDADETEATDEATP